MAESWKVIGQRESTEIGPDQRFTPTVIVTFQTGLGYTGTVSVPKAAFTADNVRNLIDEQVAAMHDVHNL